MKIANKTTYKKVGKTYQVTAETSDRMRIVEDLCTALINKKIYNAPYIKRISDDSGLVSTREITVVYDNGYKDVYTVEF